MSEKQIKHEEVTKKYGDPWIWGIYFTLVIISIIESYSASSREVPALGIYMPLVKQCIFLLIGGVMLYFIHRIDYNNRTLLAFIIYILPIITLASLVYMLMFGEVINGAQRAIKLPGNLTIQPAELAKLTIVTILSNIFARNQRNQDVASRGLFIAALSIALFGFFLIKSGLTNTLLLMAISVSMMLIGGTKIRKIAITFLAYSLILGTLFIIKGHNDKQEQLLNNTTGEIVVNGNDTIAIANSDNDKTKISKSGLRDATWQNRLHEWWESDKLVYRPITNKNQQEMFSRMAQAHGGIVGVGIGNSRECSRLPLAFSDYIYSIIIEEMGFIGGVFVLILYLWLLARALMIARRCRRVLPALLITGMASMIVFQALFHMAINVGVFPVSGQPLPLISKGGTSIVVTNIAFGIMLSISRTIANAKDKKSSKNEENQLPDELRAENPTQLIRPNEWK